MADYYPLLARAAAGLTDASPDARQAMYARARKALLGQLGAMDPPLGEEDISRESVALDEAIARVEADLFSKTADVAAGPPPPSPPPPAPSPTGPFSARRSPAPQPTPAASSPPAAPAPTPTAPPAPEQAAAEEVAVEEIAAPPPPPPPPPEKIEEPPVAIRPRERPPAPTPPEPRGQHSRLWILGGVVAIVVAAVAAAALKLRNSPDELAKLKPIAAPTAETNASGKIAERVGRDDSPATVAATPPARSTAAPGSSTPAATTPPPTVTQAPIPVAQRAALLIEAPDLESKVRTFLGSTVWRLDNVPSGAGQPIGTAVHADVEVPEAKVRLSLDMKKNVDPALPAASTIEVRFTLLPGSIFPGISQIAVPQMRREENPNGDSLAGVPVKITDTYFLVGLAQGDYSSRNNDLMRSRGWIDIPIQLSDNRIAKIALEKGAIGDRIVADALATWTQ